MQGIIKLVIYMGDVKCAGLVESMMPIVDELVVCWHACVCLQNVCVSVYIATAYRFHNHRGKSRSICKYANLISTDLNIECVTECRPVFFE